jgi:hypothetical protein
MADRSPEKKDMLLATGDAVLGLPIPDDASETYLKHRRLTEEAIREGRVDTVECHLTDDQPPSPRLK